jgi:beta-lactamase regulating signal transducer with metallopeptidase domain
MWKKRWIVVGIAATVLPLVLASCAGSTSTVIHTLNTTQTVTKAASTVTHTVTQAPSTVPPTPTPTATPTSTQAPSAVPPIPPTLSTPELVEKVKASVVLIVVELPGGIDGSGHIHPPEFVHRYSNRELELAITAALGAPLA